MRKIFDMVLGGQIPNNVQTAFQRWFISDTEEEEKAVVMEEIWDEMIAEKASLKPCGKPSYEDILSDAKKMDTDRFRRCVTSFSLASFALCVCAMIFVLVYSSKNTTTILASSEGCKAAYVLPDGSKVVLNKDSSLKYKGDLSSGKRTVVLSGEAYFDVVKKDGKKFTVVSPHAKVTVLGTRFSVDAYPGKKLGVYLAAGKVNVEGPEIGSEDLFPGEAVLFDPASGKAEKRKINPSNHISWIENELNFQNVPLSDIIENLEHWYNVDIDYLSSVDPSGIRLSFAVKGEPCSEILEAIAILSGLNYSMNGKQPTIY